MDENTWLQPPGALASSAYSAPVLEGVSPLLGRLTASQCMGKWELGSPALPWENVAHSSHSFTR